MSSTEINIIGSRIHYTVY